MNKIIIQGRVTQALEVKQTNGTSYCRVPVAVSRSYAKQGEERKTDFFDCICFNRTAEFVEKYFNKGDGIIITGEMQSHKYQDKNGDNRVGWSIRVENVEFPMGRKAEGNSNNTGYDEPDNAYSAAPMEEVEDDGDLPF